MLAGTPMDHYFNLYIPAFVQGGAAAPGSKHAAYRAKLQRHEGFVSNTQKNGHKDINAYIGLHEQVFRTLKTTLARQRVVLKHMYCQDLDYRLYAHNFTTNGWCLGIAGFWLRQKRNGVNVFPNVIYNSYDLETDKGAPIKLMSNQQKLLEHAGMVQVGGQDKIPFQAKNVLDYIAGGHHSGGIPSIWLNMTNGKEQIGVQSRRLHSMLAPRAASAEEKAADRFIVLHFLEGGGGHMMALDMEAVEFFDPNFGVFTVANQSRQKLIDFVFQKFYPICYPRDRIKDFYIVRIE
ncbi:MAG: YopT-type cysteine protease domain-containing protein [Desulfobacterales bacterium]|nr:YopT-type cysteine protease domain-containing protein [Desulfobacterales bacterium]